MGGQFRELAIFIQEFSTQSQFYTMRGDWVHISSRMVTFSVPNFVDARELDQLRSYLPSAEIPKDMENKLQQDIKDAPRSVGQALISKMLDFWAQAERVYQTNSTILDNAHAKIAQRRQFRYATLDKITNELLPKLYVNNEDSKIPQATLYAVHRALFTNGVGIKPPVRRTLRAGGYYEILSRNDMTDVKFVRDLVRKYVDSKISRRSGDLPLGTSPLLSFAAKARRLVDLSRKNRPFTHEHGVSIVCMKENDSGDDGGLDQVESFNATDKRIIKFLELWTAFRTFAYSSPLNSTGAVILRAIERYDEELALDRRLGWFFLEEIGIVSPWASWTSYEMKLPGIGLRLSAPQGEDTQGFVSDKLKDIRHDWSDLPVYCIDSSDAHEIDDGVSIEAADIPEHYWVHVHIANPGAHINPASAVARFAEKQVESVYLPHRTQKMLSSAYVQANLSLANNRPCLTISSKMNKSGDILDYKVTPGIIRNVQNLNPSLAEKVIRNPPYKRKNNFYVVGNVKEPSASRHMTQLHELSDIDKTNLRLLYEVGEGYFQKQQTMGLVSSHPAQFNISVTIDDLKSSTSGVSTHYSADPTIKVSTKIIDSPVPISSQEASFDAVRPLMMMAGEIAARWCSERGIPVVYRSTARNEDKANPSEFFAKHVLPTKNEQGEYDREILSAYFKLIGSVQPSTIPGPHVAMGLPMYTRCTSPLRRYPDLLLQWQVEAALLEEVRSGKSLVGNKSDDFLPFSKSHIDDLLPYFDARERLLTWSEISEKQHWFRQFLLRATEHGQAKIPETFSFVVLTVNEKTNSLRGSLSHFQLNVSCECPTWASLEEFSPGDILEVKLSDISLFDFHTWYTAIRRLDQAEKETLDQENLKLMESEDVT